MPPKTRGAKAGKACERCRRQKLKCDIKRPCTMCVHSGKECVVNRFVLSGPPRPKPKRQKKQNGSAQPGESQQEDQHIDNEHPLEQPSSSTMSLVAGAFQLHDSSTPDTSMTTAFPGGVASSSVPGKMSGRSGYSIPWMQGSLSATTELVRLLPPREVASLLIDTYFDRVHWFILIFHQDDFRRNWQLMYELSAEQLIHQYPNPGFISTFLVVIAIALQYTGSHRQKILRNLNIDHTAMKENILSTIRARLLDIVSLGSLESVQTCVLLGTYYLYHGNPGLAWPVCGCGLRVAQALNLHRKMPTSNGGSISPEMQRLAETRKRCWWAIYEIETFCSMSYGYPHGIKDDDCDVELLDPLAISSGQSPATFDTKHQCPASLLSYKYLMSKLSVLVKDILTDLYGISHRGDSKTNNPSSRTLQNIIRKVSRLDNRIQQWKKEIPDALRPSTSTPTYSSMEEMDFEIGASGPKFEQHVYQLQALSLQLAYENARILLHRPLLAYKIVPQVEYGPHSPNYLHLSLAACREAALHTSNLSESPIFLLAADTYAAAFIGIHTFTAGVMLCILSSIEPLSPQSHDSKMGMRRLLKMQGHLKSRTQSALAAQGLAILERLTRLVMDRELKEMLVSDSTISQPSHPVNQQPGHQSNGQQDTTEEQVAPLPEAISDEGMFEFIQDPAMSQALLDFDHALFGNDTTLPLEPLFPDLAGPGNGLTQEQAWIWGMDNSLPFSGAE